MSRKKGAPSSVQGRFAGLFFAQKEDLTGGRIFWPAAALLIVSVAVLAYCNLRSPDLWWQLKTGELILKERAIPRADPFSHTAEGEPWVSHEWLFGLLSFGVYRLGGLTGLVAAKSLLIALIFFLAAWTARLRGAGPGMISLVLAASYGIARFRFTERPELVSIALAQGFVLAHEGSRRRLRWILLLPVLQLLWVNAHGGTALLGWLLAVALLLDRAWQVRAETGSAGPPRTMLMRAHLLAAAGVVAVSFLNPHGYRALSYGLLRAESPFDNKEFQSLPRLMGAGIDQSIVLFLLFAALLVTLLLWRSREARLYEWLLLPSLLLLTVVFFRFRPLVVFLLGPTLALHLSRAGPLGRLRAWVPTIAAVVLLARCAALERATYFYRFGAGIHTGVFPVEAADFVRRAGLRGQMFNTYGMGGYLIWALWPEKKVFIDGREDVYLGPGVLEEYIHCFDTRERWQALLDKYEIDFAIIRYPESPPTRPDRSLDILAFPREKWALVYFDEVALIYARRNGKNDALIRSREIKAVQPLQLSGYLDEIVKNPERLRLFLAEIHANMQEHPSSFRNHFTLGVLAVKRGPAFLEEALRQFQRTVDLNPDFAPAHANLGSIYLHLGRAADAARSLKRALSLEENAAARAQLKRLSNRRWQ